VGYFWPHYDFKIYFLIFRENVPFYFLQPTSSGASPHSSRELKALLVSYQRLSFLSFLSLSLTLKFINLSNHPSLRCSFYREFSFDRPLVSIPSWPPSNRFDHRCSDLLSSTAADSESPENHLGCRSAIIMPAVKSDGCINLLYPWAILSTQLVSVPTFQITSVIRILCCVLPNLAWASSRSNKLMLWGQGKTSSSFPAFLYYYHDVITSAADKPTGLQGSVLHHRTFFACIW